ncbi:MAG: glycine--tRNA ligase subunit beta [Alphaproteobacteria bacterium]|nr:glycine--tRNA ligase subunit beta [Rickettsiales bacterium]
MEAEEAKKKPNIILLEIFSDDIPPGMQNKFAKEIIDTAVTDLKAKNINVTTQNIKSYITPLRMALICHLNGSFLNTITVKGPKLNANLTALQGFMKKHNIESKKLLSVKDNHYCYQLELKKSDIEKILSNAFYNILSKSAKIWDKQMIWTKEKTKWVRPIHSIIFMLNNKVLNLNFAGVQSSNTTYSSRRKILHTMHSNGGDGKISINSASEYLSIMQRQNILMSQSERETSVKNQLDKICKDLGLQISIKKQSDQYANLIQKNANMCEIPFVAIGQIGENFLSLPEMILEQTMIQYQNYIPMSCQGKISNFAFIFEMKGSLKDDMNNTLVKNIILGNQNVLSARLQDAQYFLNEDLKKFGQLRVNKSSDIQKVKEELELMLTGSLHSPSMKTRSDDIAQIFLNITETNSYTAITNKTNVLNYLLFSKLDLRTRAVNNLSDLQGKIGGDYWSKWWGKDLDTNTKNLFKEIFTFQYDGILKNNNKLTRYYAIANNIENILFNIAQGRKFSSSADPFGINKSAMRIFSIAIGDNVFTKHVKNNTTMDIFLESNDILNFSLSTNNLFLPLQYKHFTEQLSSLLTKALDKTLKNISPDFILSKNINIYNNSLQEIWKEAVINYITFHQKENYEIAEELYNRTSGLSEFNIKQLNKLLEQYPKLQLLIQEKYLSNKLYINQQTQQPLTKQDEQIKSTPLNSKTLDLIYNTIIQNTILSKKSLQAVTQEITDLEQLLHNLTKQKYSVLTSSSNIKIQIKNLTTEYKANLSQVKDRLSSFLQNNMINNPNCIYTTIKRKQAMLRMSLMLQSLFPSIK